MLAGVIATGTWVAGDLLSQYTGISNRDFGCVGWTGWWSLLWDEKLQFLAIWVPIVAVVIQALRLSSLYDGLIMSVTLFVLPSLAEIAVMVSGGDVLARYCNVLDSSARQLSFLTHALAPIAIIPVMSFISRRRKDQSLS